MKVGFVPLYDIHGPSSRYRVFQFVAPLSRHGFVCSVLKAPAGNLRKRMSYPARLSAQSLQSDVLYIQKRTFPSWVLRTLKRLNPHIIFDLDDAIYLQSWNTHKANEIIQLSNAVVAGNQVLVDYALQYNPNTHITTTVVSTEFYQPKLNKHSPEEKRTVLGWIGIDPNRGDLDLLKPVFGWLAEQSIDSVVLRTVGKRPLEMNTKLEVEFIPWTLDTSLSLLQTFDIGLMPLEDTPWNRGKCGLKLIEYQAVGTPAVASPVGVNTEIIKDGETGFLAKNETDWQAHLKRLIEDQKLRRRMGQVGRQHIAEHYSIEAVLPKLIAVLEGVASNQEHSQ